MDKLLQVEDDIQSEGGSEVAEAMQLNSSSNKGNVSDIVAGDPDIDTVPLPDNEIASYLATSGEAKEPRTYAEAMASPDADKWAKAAAEEYGMLMARGTWVLEDLPEEKKTIGCRWVFKIKRASNGEITRFKARLVAQGFTQKFGVDYFETYSPVAGLPTIRLLMAWAVERGMLIDQFDLQNAYIHGTLDTTVYMRQPEGYVEPGMESKVCRIVRSLYGLNSPDDAGIHVSIRECFDMECSGVTPIHVSTY